MGKVFRALQKFREGYTAETNEGRERTGLEKSSQDGDCLADTEEPQSSSVTGILRTGHWDERLLKVVSSSGRLPESFRVLRSRILHPPDEEKSLRTILVTSTAPEEGKSFITANLGISLARGMDQYCLMVDCDLRRPTLAALFGMSTAPGLSDYLQSRCDISGIIKKTSIDKLTLLGSGRPPVNPSELLGSLRMQGLVHELSSRYEDRLILFDSPPDQAASETSVLAKQVDGVVLVARWGASGRDHIKRLVEDIGREKIIGVVFNGFKTNIVESKFLNYYDHYYHEYPPGKNL
jgi:exopolysaccharide/PEP-CTERM locus tyrosine autokinase